MEETQSKMWFSGVALLPYLALAGIWTWFDGGRQKGFWTAAGVLIGGRILYAVLDSITSSIAWRTYGRRRTADNMRKLFESAAMPLRAYPTETLALYLSRIDQDDGEHSVAVKCVARQLDTLVKQSKADGILQGGRMEQAINDAYHLYTIRSTVQNPLDV